MDTIGVYLIKTLSQVWETFLHNWPFLAVSILIAVGLKLFLDPNKISAYLTRYRRAGVIGATVVAVTTPLCSCGTTAVILGMLASTIPWAPVIAFMVTSPLTSPQELIYSAGLFGWPFALAFFISSILLGLLGGLAGEILERRGWLANQNRFARTHPSQKLEAVTKQPAAICECAGAANTPAATPRYSLAPAQVYSQAAVVGSMQSGAGEAVLQISCCPIRTTQETCSCDDENISREVLPPSIPAAVSAGKLKITPSQVLSETWNTSKRLLLMFFGFAFIGYFLNGLIPSSWVAAVFGQGNIYSVPLAATLGLPFYINTEASLPLVRALIEGGMSQGAALAFLITGAGTSIGALGGALSIARWRVIGVVVSTLWLGAIAMGLIFDFLVASHLF